MLTSDDVNGAMVRVKYIDLHTEESVLDDTKRAMLDHCLGDQSAPDILDAHSSSGSSQTTYPCTQTYIDYTYVNCRDWTVPMVTEAMLSNNPHFAETCADHKGDFALSVV